MDGRVSPNHHELDALERAADADPADRRLAAAVVRLADRLAIEAHPPPELGPDAALVRADGVSAQWLGTERSSGERLMVRVLRPELRAGEVWRRYLRREARALALVAPIAVTERDGVPSIRLRARGSPLGVRRGERLARPLLTALAAIGRWERAGLGLPPLAADELRVEDGRVDIACLCPAAEPGAHAAIASVAERLAGSPDDALCDEALGVRVRALALHPCTVDEAGRLVQRALAEELTARRHALAAAWRDTWHHSRVARLRAAVGRLHRSVPAPVGRGAVGVDLDGQITVLESDGENIRWGALGGGAAEAVYDAIEGFRPPAARHLLRVRACSLPNPTLDARVGGDPAATEAICRWVAAGLRLRTVLLLLERAPEPR